jgi:hypothetical protein
MQICFWGSNLLIAMQGSAILRGEMARIEGGKKHMAQLDMSATSLPTPRLNEQEDISAWQASSSNAAAQLEHQHNRCAHCWRTMAFVCAAVSIASVVWVNTCC